jgi:oxygen-independent coproporphyrinogen-3 oxidase
MSEHRSPIAWNVPSPLDQKSFAPHRVFAAGMRHHHLANTAYPIHHQTTMRPYRVGRDRIQDTVVAAWHDIEHLGLYIHVPFCAARCTYCEYAVVDQNEPQLQKRYFEALAQEIGLYRTLLNTTAKTVIGLDIGGGTPSFVSAEHIQRILSLVRQSFCFLNDMTISIETTPAIADQQPDKIHAYKEMGIDRISMGVQTTHVKLARAIGREYKGPSMLDRAVRNIRNAGFTRFNIDLMYGFADQEPASWQRTLEQTIALAPEYITLYQMRYKGTRLQHQSSRVSLAQINNLRQIARAQLHTAGYANTPGKNTYTKIPGDPGTSDYLTERVVRGTPYLGLGLGAQSLSHHTLSYNSGAASKKLESYLRAIHQDHIPVQDIYHLPLAASMAKMISVSFYFGQIHLGAFRAKFGVRLEDQFPAEIAYVVEHGLMHYADPYLQLTKKGARCFNGVIALFYAGAVKDYLVHLAVDRAQKQEIA